VASRKPALGDFEQGLKSIMDSQNSKCDMSRLLRELSPADAQKVQAALDNPIHSSAIIAKGLNKTVANDILGRPIGESSVQRHRRGTCCRRLES
jgi:hypothetical protein